MDEFNAKFSLYADTFPLVVAGILGGADTVAGGGPYTHTMHILYDPSSGNQPPSYSIMDFDGGNYFLLAGSQASDLTIAWAADAETTGVVRYICNPYADSTSAPTPFGSVAFSTEVMPPGWATSVSIGGSVLNLSSGELKLDRKTEAIFTAQGTVDSPLVNFAGPIEATGNFKGLVNTDEDPWSTSAGGDEALTRDQQAISVTFTDPVSSHSLAFTMDVAQLHDVKRTRGKIYTEIEANFTALMNATDADTGYGPVTFVATNAVAGAYV